MITIMNMNYYRKTQQTKINKNEQKELTKVRNKKWKKFKEKQTSEAKKLESKGQMTKSLSANSLSLLIGKEEISTSKVTEQNETTDIVFKKVLENDFYHTRFNILAKNVLAIECSEERT